jgi:DNA-binding CsgD family transcriptional regulator
VRSNVRHHKQSQLSERELSVLHHMARGLTDQEIGGAVGISEFTVKTHVRRLYRKLAAKNRAHAVARGLVQGHLTT